MNRAFWWTGLSLLATSCSVLVFDEERLVTDEPSPHGEGGGNVVSTSSVSSSSSGALVSGAGGQGGHGGCAPIICEVAGFDCGATSDGCGDMIDCGTCPEGPAYCGLDGRPNVCGQAPPFELVSVVSRRTHGSAGEFDVPLPLTGLPGVECRSGGGDLTIVFSFDSGADVTGGSAELVVGDGAVQDSTFSGTSMRVRLTGVADVQEISIAIADVTNALDQMIPGAEVTLVALLGDTTGNRTVTQADWELAARESGQALNTANFRGDANVTGSINAGDVSVIKAKVGNYVP